MTAQPNENVLPFTSKPTASFVNVTPELANRWLKGNVKNRKLRRQDLNRYKRDMVAGNWRLDGAPVRFSPDGCLLDGQHRLTAIVETKLTVPMLVVRGINPDAQSVMDTGRKRTAGDALSINGHKNATAVAAAARLGLAVEAKVLSLSHYEVSHEEVIGYIEDNPDLSTAVDFLKSYTRRTDCPPAVASYTYMVMRRINSKDASEFWVSMAEKVGLTEGDPVIALSNRLAESRRLRESLPKDALLSLIYRAWNARRTGNKMRIIRLNSPAGGFVPIPVPK